MPKKGKGNGKKGRKSTGGDEPLDPNVLFDMQEELNSLLDELIDYRSEVDKLTEENYQLTQQSLQTREDHNEYMDESRKRVETTLAEIEDLKRVIREQEEEAERYSIEVVDSLEKELHILMVEIDNKAYETVMLKKRLSDMEPYKEIQETQLGLLQTLQSDLEDHKEMRNLETRELKNGLSRERRNLERLLRRDLNILSVDIERHVRPCMAQRLQMIRDSSTLSRDHFMAILKKKCVLESRKDMLVKLDKSLEEENQYWSDLNSIHQKEPLVRPDWEIDQYEEELECEVTSESDQNRLSGGQPRPSQPNTSFVDSDP